MPTLTLAQAEELITAALIRARTEFFEREKRLARACRRGSRRPEGPRAFARADLCGANKKRQD